MWNFNKILNVSGWQIIKVVKEKDKMIFLLKQRRITADCPKCRKTTKTIHSYDKTRAIKNGTILGRLCVLKFKPRRFRCQNCLLVFTEKISLLNNRQRVTQNHKIEVIFNLSDRSFSSSAKKYKVSYNTQRRWLNELVKDKLFDFHDEEEKNKPFVLGIDEVSFAGCDMVTTIGNISKHRLKGILSSRRKDEFKKVLRSFSPKIKSLISEVVIDMNSLYLRVVKETLPKVEIVVDHFHLIQDAN